MGLLDFRDFWRGTWRLAAKRRVLALLAALLIAWGVWETNYVQNVPLGGKFYETVGYDEREVAITRDEWIRNEVKDAWFLVAIGLIVIAIFWQAKDRPAG